jgi:hypothetical protein
MTQQILSENNFLQYALKNYDNPSCTIVTEFEDDLKRFLYLKKLFKRYKISKDLNELKVRLILNHIIIIFNLWGDVATNMLFFKVEKENWDSLIPFLIYLGRLPEFIPSTNIRTTEIQFDEQILIKIHKEV